MAVLCMVATLGIGISQRAWQLPQHKNTSMNEETEETEVLGAEVFPSTSSWAADAYMLDMNMLMNTKDKFIVREKR